MEEVLLYSLNSFRNDVKPLTTLSVQGGKSFLELLTSGSLIVSPCILDLLIVVLVNK
jgi:hypothetical protein